MKIKMEKRKKKIEWRNDGNPYAINNAYHARFHLNACKLNIDVVRCLFSFFFFFPVHIANFYRFGIMMNVVLVMICVYCILYKWNFSFSLSPRFDLNIHSIFWKRQWIEEKSEKVESKNEKKIVWGKWVFMTDWVKMIFLTSLPVGEYDVYASLFINTIFSFLSNNRQKKAHVKTSIRLCRYCMWNIHMSRRFTTHEALRNLRLPIQNKSIPHHTCTSIESF